MSEYDDEYMIVPDEEFEKELQKLNEILDLANSLTDECGNITRDICAMISFFSELSNDPWTVSDYDNHQMDALREIDLIQNRLKIIKKWVNCIDK